MIPRKGGNSVRRLVFSFYLGSSSPAVRPFAQVDQIEPAEADDTAHPPLSVFTGNTTPGKTRCASFSALLRLFAGLHPEGAGGLYRTFIPPAALVISQIKHDHGQLQYRG